jgi:hypothetical protein
MDTRVGLWIEGGLLLFTFFVVVPSIAATIGYAAWKGKPKSFNRETYGMAFVTAGAVSVFLMVYGQKMQADVRTWQYLLQLVLFGIAGGCGVGVFTYRRSSPPQELTQ